MMYLISIAHLFVCLLVIYSAWLLFRSNRHTLLAFVLIAFILMDSIGLVIAPYLPLENIKYLTNPIFLINDGDSILYLRQIFAQWIFLTISLLGILFEMSRTKKKSNGISTYRKSTMKMFGFLFFAIGLATYVKYFLFGPGLYILFTTSLFFSSTSEAILSRSLTRSIVQYGQGSYIASLASAIVFPISALFLLRCLNKGKWVLFTICSFLSFAYVFQTRQKGPLLFWFLTYFLLFVLEKQNLSIRDYKNILKNKLVLKSLLVAFCGTVLLYIVNFGQSLVNSVEATLVRIFIIPGAVENYYFAVFPHIYSYRGLSRIFEIPLGYLPVNNDISIYDVAQAVTGMRSSTNASFLAIAWSGAGFLGVFITSAMFVFILVFIGIALDRLEYREYLGVLVLSLYSLVGLSSGSIMNYISKGGIVIPMIVIFVFRFTKIKLRETS